MIEISEASLQHLRTAPIVERYRPIPHTILGLPITEIQRYSTLFGINAEDKTNLLAKTWPVLRQAALEHTHHWYLGEDFLTPDRMGILANANFGLKAARGLNSVVSKVHEPSAINIDQRLRARAFAELEKGLTPVAQAIHKIGNKLFGLAREVDYPRSQMNHELKMLLLGVDVSSRIMKRNDPTSTDTALDKHLKALREMQAMLSRAGRAQYRDEEEEYYMNQFPMVTGIMQAVCALAPPIYDKFEAQKLPDDAKYAVPAIYRGMGDNYRADQLQQEVPWEVNLIAGGKFNSVEKYTRVANQVPDIFPVTGQEWQDSITSDMQAFYGVPLPKGNYFVGQPLIDYPKS